MKQINFAIFTAFLIISAAYPASHDDEATQTYKRLRKIIRTRSLKNFKAQQSYLQQLDIQHLEALTEMCATYNTAIATAYDLQVHPEIERSLQNMLKDFKITRRQDASYTLHQHIAQLEKLISNQDPRYDAPWHHFAFAVLKTYNTPAWYALRKIKFDFQTIDNATFLEQARRNHDNLNAIISILKQEQSKRDTIESS